MMVRSAVLSHAMSLAELTLRVWLRSSPAEPGHR